ncbi:hypothetical protein [Glaciihabitans sp. dw_435]|uniref:hypothetical protein n=1 Tax=Glaciihabitans sp. dw_435 TaxID=2720081 RepID=UPI001BD35DEA|nr:hypothetical protein [Glaciihabitans sp. dw_435]
MATLALLGYNDEPSARAAFERILHLHSVALLTLEGAALLERMPGGSLEIADTPPETVGLERVDSTELFDEVIKNLTQDVPVDAIAGTILVSLRLPVADHPAELANLTDALGSTWVIANLADDVAEAAVAKQLEDLDGTSALINFTSVADETPMSKG